MTSTRTSHRSGRLTERGGLTCRGINVTLAEEGDRIWVNYANAYKTVASIEAGSMLTLLNFTDGTGCSYLHADVVLLQADR